MIKYFVTGLVAMLVMSAVGAEEKLVMLGRFSAGDRSHWEEKEFAGQTSYEFATVDGRKALRAHSKQAASGLFREMEVDLTKTPILNWSWKVENIFSGNDEQTKAGDDYPARIYVVFSGGIWFWKSRALNFVWSSNQPQDTVWKNAFTDHAIMIAMESGDEFLGQWRGYKVDIPTLYRKYFGEEIDTISAVAIMTDTDNAGGEATAYYGDVFFSEE